MDTIDECSKILDAEGAVVQYDLSYLVVDPNDETKQNSFCVVVLASEMTDPTSESEAKTKANVKAAAIKAAWLAQAETTAEDVASVVGAVTL